MTASLNKVQYEVLSQVSLGIDPCTVRANFQSISLSSDVELATNKPVTSCAPAVDLGEEYAKYPKSKLYHGLPVVKKQTVSGKGNEFQYRLETVLVPPSHPTFGGSKPYTITSAFNMAGHYIGDEATAIELCEKRGIAPVLADPKHKTCSIGYCKRENKWYGWSHRAIFGFTVGSSVVKGDCAYIAKTIDEWARNIIDDYTGVSYTVHKVTVENDTLRICYDFLESKNLVDYHVYKGGRGEWKAETMEHAREMAVTFAESVSSVDKETVSVLSTKDLESTSGLLTEVNCLPENYRDCPRDQHIKYGVVIKERYIEGLFPTYTVRTVCVIYPHTRETEIQEYAWGGDGVIGSPELAEILVEQLGIKCQVLPNEEKCSIGYSEKDGLWYGWNEDNIKAFGIGTEVGAGCAGYSPQRFDEWKEYVLNTDYFCNKNIYNVTHSTSGNVLTVSCQYTDYKDMKTVKYYKYRGGCGNWKANTLADARHMAVDFVEHIKTTRFLTGPSNVNKGDPVYGGTVREPHLKAEAAAKKTADDYGWFRFGGRTAKNFENRYYEMELSPKEVYGIRKGRGKFFIVDLDALGETEFGIDQRTTQQLLASSKPFKGRVQGKVRAGDLSMADAQTRVTKTKVKNIDLSGVPLELRGNLNISAETYVGIWRSRLGKFPYTMVKGTKKQVIDQYELLLKGNSKLEYGTVPESLAILRKFENRSVSSINISDAQFDSVKQLMKEKRIHKPSASDNNYVGVWSHGNKEQTFSVVQGSERQVKTAYKRLNTNPESQLVTAQVSVDFPILRGLGTDEDKHITRMQAADLRKVMKNRRVHK